MLTEDLAHCNSTNVPICTLYRSVRIFKPVRLFAVFCLAPGLCGAGQGSLVGRADLAFQRRKREKRVKGSGLSPSHPTLLHDPANAGVVHSKILGQLHHGVAACGIGRLKGCVAVVWELVGKRHQRQRAWPALGLGDFQMRLTGVRRLLLVKFLPGQPVHFVDKFVVTQENLPAKRNHTAHAMDGQLLNDPGNQGGELGLFLSVVGFVMFSWQLAEFGGGQC